MSSNQTGKPVWHLAIREPGGEVFGDFALAKPFEGHLGAHLTDEKILLEGLQRVVGEHHVARSVIPEKKELGRFTATGQRRNDVERGMIRPVEVFQDQKQASLRSDGFQRFADLAHHPLACGSENLLLKSLLLISPYQRRKLYQPGRRAQGQSLDYKSRIRIADKAAQRFEQGVIGFLASISFYALAAGN